MIMMRRSTKRALSGVAALALVILLVWGMVRVADFRAPGETLLSIIPSETRKTGTVIAAIGVNNLERVYSEVISTSFYEALKESGLYQKLTGGLLTDTEAESEVPAQKEKIIGLLGKKALVSFYGSPAAGYSFLAVSRIGDLTGVKELIHGAALDKDEIYSSHRDVPIILFSKEGLYAFTDGYLLLSSREELLKASIDLIKEENASGSLHAAHSWMEEKLGRESDLFAFISNKEASRSFGPLASPAIRSEFSFYEVTFDDGIKIRSFYPHSAEAASRVRFNDSALGLIPRSPILAGAISGVDVREKYESISSDRGMLPLSSMVDEDLDIQRDILPLLGSSFAYALMVPSEESRAQALPVFMILAEAADKGALNQLYKLTEKILGIDMITEKYEGIEYKRANFPAFLGQRLEVSAVGLSAGSKHFLALTTSEMLTEKIIDLSTGKGESLKTSPEWRGISRRFPSHYSGISYADMNALLGTAGLFYASITGREELRGLIQAGPLSWAGPLGSAVNFESGFRVSDSYLPIQDLSIQKWSQILEEVQNTLY